MPRKSCILEHFKMLGLILALLHGLGANASNDTQLCVGGVCIDKSYVKYEPPGEEVEVFLDFWPLSVNTGATLSEVNDDQFTLTLHTILVLSWKDPRIRIDSTYKRPLTIRKDIRKFLWKPFVYMDNLKSAETMELTKDMKGKGYNFIES